MEELDYWRLCEDLNIVQAALLVVGDKPNLAEYTEDHEVHKRPLGYEAAKTAITGALKLYKKYEAEVSNLEMQSRGFQDEHGNAPDLVIENQDYLSSMLRRSIEGELVPKYDFDINGYPKAPPSFRIWGGATVEPHDVKKLLPWISWAFYKVKSLYV